jgi:hypothetical protein
MDVSGIRDERQARVSDGPARRAAWYAIAVGVLMGGMWLVFVLTGQVPELATEPWSIGMHLAAEFLTALVLVASGVGLLRARWWGERLYLVGMGMLFYTLVQSPGYYLERGEPVFVAMFALLAVGGLVLLAPWFRRQG